MTETTYRETRNNDGPPGHTRMERVTADTCEWHTALSVVVEPYPQEAAADTLSYRGKATRLKTATSSTRWRPWRCDDECSVSGGARAANMATPVGRTTEVQPRGGGTNATTAPAIQLGRPTRPVSVSTDEVCLHERFAKTKICVTTQW